MSLTLTPAEHDPDQAMSNTTAGLWSEDSAGGTLGLSARQELLQRDRLGNQGALLPGRVGGPFVQVSICEQCFITLEPATHYNQSQVARRVAEGITKHLFQSLMPLLILSKK